MDELDTEAADSGTKVALYADAGLTHKGQPILSPVFSGKVTTEALMQAQEILRKGVVL